MLKGIIVIVSSDELKRIVRRVRQCAYLKLTSVSFMVASG